MEGKVDIGQNIADLVTGLAQQIGTTADKVFPWYVQQQYIEGVFFVVVIALIIFISASLCLFSVKGADFENGNTKAVVFIAAGVIGALAIFVFILGGRHAISQIINPNYHAVHCMLKDFSNLR